VKHILEGELEAAADARHLVEGQRRLVQLAVGDSLRHHPLDGLLQFLRPGVAQRARGRLDPVGQHNERRLAGLRPRAGVAEVCFGRRRFPAGAGRLEGALVKVADQGRAVVLADAIRHRSRQPVPLGQFDAVGYVLPDEAGGLRRRDPRVRVGAVALVLTEESGPLRFADVVE